METLLSYCVGFGLATGAGGRACLALLALGAFHHSSWFELAPQFVWLGSPVVMAVLGVLGLVEILADAHPELSELVELANWMPKIVAGFIAFAAATGQVDDGLLQLGASGVMGSVTAGTADYLRRKLRAQVREVAQLTHREVDRVYSLGETGVAGAMSAIAVIAPVLVPAAVLVVGGLAFWTWRRLDARRVPCVHEDCEAELRPGAVVCPVCRREQAPV